MVALRLGVALAADALWTQRSVVADTSAFSVKEVGNEHRLYVGDKQHSFWHDIPFDAGVSKIDEKVYHFVCEMPMGDTAKREVSHTEPFNPIVHETIEGEATHLKHTAADGWTGPFLNDGSFPQTWESPSHKRKPSRKKGIPHFIGDNKPLDAIMINHIPCKVGAIHRVRILGAFAIIHDDDLDIHTGPDTDLDWKVVVQDVDDPDAPPGDIREVMSPGQRSALQNWYKHHEIANGGKEKVLYQNGAWSTHEAATKLVQEFHEHWETLFAGKADL